ncbi:MAG TPA: hypothetical protein VNW06_04840 [Cytophagaceae bacterium]|nr:hypothetical protein [Cytophagaceae bacterium]
MKYLHLNNSEIKKLLYTRREIFIIYAVTLLIISAGSYILLQLILRTYLSMFLVSFLAIVYTSYIVYINRKFLEEVICKQKKVYRGVLSFKTISPRSKKGKYIFNVDGRIFYVNRKDFEYIKEGDVVELHVSSSTKHLFCVEKID